MILIEPVPDDDVRRDVGQHLPGIPLNAVVRPVECPLPQSQSGMAKHTRIIANMDICVFVWDQLNLYISTLCLNVFAYIGDTGQ